MPSNLIKKVLICSLISASFSTAALAQRRPSAAPSAKDIQYDISPIIGYETVYRSTPSPHTVTRLMYGARLTAGLDIISGELEYTTGTDTKNFTVAPEKVVVKDEKLKLGARSTFRLTELFNAAIRFGGQAKRSTEEVTNTGVTTTEEKPIEYSPYAGAAFGIQLGKTRISIGTTVVFKDINDMEKNEYQNVVTFGFKL